MAELKLAEKLLKQIGMGLNTTRLYPPGHPAFAKIIEESERILNEFSSSARKTISVYFLENIILFEDQRIEASKTPVIMSLIKHFSKIGVTSLSIDRDALEEDWNALYAVLAEPIKTLRDIDDISVLLHQKGADRIRFNDVDFGVITQDQKIELKFDLDSVLEKLSQNQEVPESDITNIVSEMGGVTQEDIIAGDAEKITQGVQRVAQSLEEKYAPEQSSIILSRAMATLSPDVRQNVMEQLTDTKEITRWVRDIIKTMPDQDLIALVISRVKKGQTIDQAGMIVPEDKRKKILSHVKQILFTEKLSQEVGGLSPQDMKIGPKEKVISGIEKITSHFQKKFGHIPAERFSTIMSQVMGMLSPEIKQEVLKDMVKTDEVAEWVKDMLKTLSEEEVVSLVIARAKEGKRSPESAMDIVPQGLEPKILPRVEEILSTGEIIPEEFQERVMELLNFLKREKEPKIAGNRIIELLKEMTGGGEMESEGGAPPFTEGLQKIAAFLVERYGENALPEFSILTSHLLSALSPEIKRNFLEYTSKLKESADMVRMLLPSLSDEDLLSLISMRTKNFPDETEDLLSALSKEKIEFLESKEIVSIPKKLLSELKIRGPSSPVYRSRDLERLERLSREKRLVITGEKKMEAMQKELKEGIRTTEIDEMIEPFLEKVKSEDPDERKYGVNSLGALLTTFLKTEKFVYVYRIMQLFTENIKNEEHPEVLFTYTDVLEKAYQIASSIDEKEIVERINKTFRDLLDQEEKRKFAIRSLGKVGSSFALRMLLTTLWEDESDDLKSALISIGEPAQDELLSLFPEIENIKVRRRILDLLTSFPDFPVDKLGKLLQDKRWSVQRDCLYILGERKDKRLIPLILPLILKGQSFVRKEAVKTLGKIGSPSAQDALIEVLNSDISGGNSEIQSEAFRALESCADENAVPSILKTLNEFLKEFQDARVPLFLSAFKILQKFPSPSAIKLLKEIVQAKGFLKRPKFPSQLRQEAVRTLSYISSEESLAILKETLNDPDSKVKITARMALEKIKK